jgi:hypothetical protein
MKDRIITCVQCEMAFVFSVAEQLRFFAAGFDAPRRCPQCRKKKTKGIELQGRRNKGKEKNPWRDTEL